MKINERKILSNAYTFYVSRYFEWAFDLRYEDICITLFAIEQVKVWSLHGFYALLKKNSL